ncbi:MAG: DUF3467 domain-containing protein [Thermoguttaceae bacterium]|jgi:hypothetical protein
MTDDPGHDPGSDPAPGHPFVQNFQHTPVGARLPEKVGRGVFSSAIMLLQTHDLFVADFLSMMVQPQQVVARIVMTGPSFVQFLAALRVNVGNYEGQLGPLAARGAAVPPGPWPGPHGVAMPPPLTIGPGMPPPEAHQGAAPAAGVAPPSIAELYEQVKFPEELLPGVFANAVMIRHTPEEFCFDFIANLFPRPVVVSRVYMAAGRVPSLMEAMSSAVQRYQQHGPSGPPPPPPPADAEGGN